MIISKKEFTFYLSITAWLFLALGYSVGAVHEITARKTQIQELEKTWKTKPVEASVIAGQGKP